MGSGRRRRWYEWRARCAKRAWPSRSSMTRLGGSTEVIVNLNSQFPIPNSQGNPYARLGIPWELEVGRWELTRSSLLILTGWSSAFRQAVDQLLRERRTQTLLFVLEIDE